MMMTNRPPFGDYKRTMYRIVLGAICAAVLASASAPAYSADREPYGIGLEGFPYP